MFMAVPGEIPMCVDVTWGTVRPFGFRCYDPTHVVCEKICCSHGQPDDPQGGTLWRGVCCWSAAVASYPRALVVSICGKGSFEITELYIFSICTMNRRKHQIQELDLAIGLSWIT
jgi:hypothetical protein